MMYEEKGAFPGPECSAELVKLLSILLPQKTPEMLMARVATLKGLG